MFTRFFFLLRAYGVPVTVTEWLALMRALAAGLALNDLDQFYSLARAVLVKSETYFDQYDQAFLAAFEGIETPAEIADEVWQWLADPLAFPGLTEEERRRLVEALGDVDLEDLRRLFEQRLAEQTEAHHGGSRWIGTGGTSPFGHDGVHPGGMRVGGAEPQPYGGQGGRRAPLPGVPHRRRGRARGSSSSPCDAFVGSLRATKASPTSSTSTRPSTRPPTTPAASAWSGARAARTP